MLYLGNLDNFLDSVATPLLQVSVGSPAGSQAWVLTIQPVRLADSGQYECQVNTEPKINLAYSLRIVRKCDIFLFYFYFLP